MWVKDTEKWRDVSRSHQRNAIIPYDGLDARIFCITIKVKVGKFGIIFIFRRFCGVCNLKESKHKLLCTLLRPNQAEYNMIECLILITPNLRGPAFGIYLRQHFPNNEKRILKQKFFLQKLTNHQGVIIPKTFSRLIY